jgi:hypothetical protein
VLADAAGPREPHPRPLGQPGALVRQQRRVGGDEDDDRARPLRADGHRVRGRRDVVEHPAHRHPVDRQPPALAVVGLDEYAHGVTALDRRPDP